MGDYNAKKYFLYGFRRVSNNENKYLVKTEMISLTRILENLNELIDDYSYDLSNNKLKRSLFDYIKLTEFYFKKSIVNEVTSLNLDLQTFYSSLNGFIKMNEESSEKNISRALTDIKLIVTMMHKKVVKKDLFTSVINLVFTTKNFGNIDRIISYLINDLVYSGHSLTSIFDWCKCNINYADIKENNIDENIEKLKLIKMEDNCYVYYMSLYNGGKYISNVINIDLNTKLETVDFDKLNSELPVEFQNHLQNAKYYDLFEISTVSKDKYSGLKSISESINSFYQLSTKVENITQKIIQDKILVKNNDEFSKLTNKDFDQSTLYSIVESKEKNDIKKFIEYRNKMLIRGEFSDEIAVIQRSLNLITRSIGIGTETKLINMWSSVEYILTYTEGNSIIGKVKDIIPKLVVMYFMHEKLNSFWYRLIRKRERLQNPQPEVLNEIYDNCRKENDRYDTEKLADYIINHGERIEKNLDFDIVLKRDILDIGTLLTNKELRKKAIENAYKNAEHELVYIYRLRNKIVHAANKSNSVNELDCLRLYQYNNNLLGMIVYYKDQNTMSTISEILHSVSYTFDEYINNIIENGSNVEICNPSYILL